MKENVLLYGHLTIDINSRENMKYQGPGGSVYFIGKFLENINYSTNAIITSYGNNFPRQVFKSSTLYPNKPNMVSTMEFENRYFKNGERHQKVRYFQDAYMPSIDRYSEIVKRTNIIMVSPLINNFKQTEIDKLLGLTAKNLHVLLPQGYFRKINSNGDVSFHTVRDIERKLKGFDIVVLSDKDCPDIDNRASHWSKIVPIVVVTKEAMGSTVYSENFKIDHKAFKISDIKDETGAGDIFAAAFAVHYYKTKDVDKSAIFANAAAGLSLRNLPNELQYGYQEIIALLN